MNLQAMAGGSKHWLIALTVRQKSPDPLRRANRSDIAVSIAGLGFKTRVWSIPRPASSQGRGRMLAARKLLLKDVPVTGRNLRTDRRICSIGHRYGDSHDVSFPKTGARERVLSLRI
jgi:hypothetical protein